MNPEQQHQFRAQGWLHLPGLLDKAVAASLKAHVLAELKRLQLWGGGRSLSGRLEGVPVFQQVGKLGQWIVCPGLGGRLMSPALQMLQQQLVGTLPLQARAPEAQLLLSLPHREDWRLEGLDWHRDVSAARMGRLPGIQAFFLIDDMVAHGGATLALAGSHRLPQALRGRHAAEQLVARSGGARTVLDGVEVSVVEMAGRAGDVYLMDMRVLHTPSINASRNVRMMATMRFLAT